MKSPKSNPSSARTEKNTHTSVEIIGTSPAMLRVFDLIRKVATVDIPILITGASGTGKEMVARTIHQGSIRAKGNFITLNCGAFPRELLLTDLMGHQIGPPTTIRGKLEGSPYGTLFLDEVGELPLELQGKLMAFLQECPFALMDGREQIQVDLQVISATSCDLKKLIAEGRFREDLYYLLNGINITLPDLKERGEDVLIIAEVFLRDHSSKLGKAITGFALEAVKAMRNYPWPGNVRELLNKIRRGIVMAEDPWITPENLDLVTCPETESPYSGLGLKAAKAKFESELVAEALMKSKGNVQLAARNLKISRSVIYQLIKKYQLRSSFP